MRLSPRSFSAPSPPGSATREFILWYRLDEEQAQSAWRICQQCEEAAREFVERNRAELDEAQRWRDKARAIESSADKPSAMGSEDAAQPTRQEGRNAALPPPRATNPAANASAAQKRVAAAGARIQRVEARLAVISQNQLKPRPEFLPTRAQRRAADAAGRAESEAPSPSSRPAQP